MRRYVPCSKNSIPFPATVSEKVSYVHTRGSQVCRGRRGHRGCRGHRGRRSRRGHRGHGSQKCRVGVDILSVDFAQPKFVLSFFSPLSIPFLCSLAFPSTLPLLFLSSHLPSSPLPSPFFFFTPPSSPPLPRVTPPPPPPYSLLHSHAVS